MRSVRAELDSPGVRFNGAVSGTHCFIRFLVNGELQVGATSPVILYPDTTFRDPACRWRLKISMSHGEKVEAMQATQERAPETCVPPAKLQPR